MKGETSTLELRDAAIPDSLMPVHDLAWWWIVAGVFLLAVSIAVLMLVIRAKSKPPHPSVLREAAFREALASITSCARGDSRAAAIGASLALRKYLSVAAADPALFETHEEFITRHDALQPFKPETRATAEAGFARLAAMKYAEQPPAASAASVTADSRVLLETLHRGFPS